MKPPPIVLLQVFNAVVGGATYLIVNLGVTALTRADWSFQQIGLTMALANLCYGAVVAAGGRLADRWGRARSGALGAAICLAGAVLPLISDAALVAAIGVMVVMAGGAVFFPGNAGLFSDAQPSAGAQAMPLYRKVGRYNLGWSAGNLGGFAAALGLIAIPDHARVIGYSLAVAALAGLMAALLRWRHLPPRPPSAEGDRADHPALARLTLMGRCTLLGVCLVGMALISLSERALGGDGADPAARDRAHFLSTLLLCGYASGYIAMFAVLGAWGGWVLRPWRLLACQAGLLACPLLLLGISATGQVHAGLLALCGVIQGLGFGASYVGSIYYSLRLPVGASRGAGLHETFLGIGSTAGPLLAGLFIHWWCSGPASAPLMQLQGLAVYALVCASACLLFQAALIPGAVKRGAR